MEVILKVIDGPEVGIELHFAESDNVLVGREDPTSKATLQINPLDGFVSRNHFMIEVRPPNVMIRDYGSRNGTYVRRKEQTDWGKRIKEALINNGDQIKIGHTIFDVIVIKPEAVGTPTKFETPAPPVDIREVEVKAGKEKEKPPEPAPPEPPHDQPKKTPQPKKEEISPEYLCIRCQTPLEELPKLEGSFHQDDFMCPNCRREVAAEREREAAARAAVQYKCHHCNADVSKAANSDKRAAELNEVALYLCKTCAERATKLRKLPIGEYRVLSELGHGGMGVVYKAWHAPTGRLAALKQMLPIAKANQNLLRRFYREVLLNEQLVHPAVVRLFEAGLEGKDPYFVSEFVTDGNLNQFMSPEDRPLLPPVDVVRLIIDALEGLEHIHKKGIVHRDLKPENILLRAKGSGVTDFKTPARYQPKLADFGLARSYERSGGTITRVGEYAGTIFYMPGEQILSFKESHPPVDIYAMGVTLYYLLTGRFSLDFPSPSQLKRGATVKKDPIMMILEDDPQPVRSQRRDLPSELCRIVDRAVAKDADDRYQTAREFRADLLKFAG